MAGTNKHGLPRRIPDGVRRAVRQRDGFGCVVCGNAFYEYEHLSPPFSECTEHRVDGIVLLCTRCHTKKTRGHLAVETVLRAAASPKCRQQGFSWEALDVGNRQPELVLGPIVFENVPVALRYFDDDVLSVSPPEVEGGPWRISAIVRDKAGNVIFEVVDNEWRTNIEAWDAEVEGRRITIRNGLGKIAFCFRTEPPHRVVVERLDISYRDAHVTAIEGKELVIVRPTKTYTAMAETTIGNFQFGVKVEEGGLAIGAGGGPNSYLRGKDLRINMPTSDRRSKAKRELAESGLHTAGSNFNLEHYLRVLREAVAVAKQIEAAACNKIPPGKGLIAGLDQIAADYEARRVRRTDE